jgi:hypothetical protein
LLVFICRLCCRRLLYRCLLYSCPYIFLIFVIRCSIIRVCPWLPMLLTLLQNNLLLLLLLPLLLLLRSLPVGS